MRAVITPTGSSWGAKMDRAKASAITRVTAPMSADSGMRLACFGTFSIGLEKRRLATPIGADEAYQAGFFDLERHVVDYGFIRKACFEVLYLEH